MKYSKTTAAVDLERCREQVDAIREAESLGPTKIAATPELLELLPRFRVNAIAIGTRLYHSAPCVHGHAPIRKATNKGSTCVECKRGHKRAAERHKMDTDPVYRAAKAAAQRESRQKHLEKRRDGERAWRAANRAKVKAKKLRHKNTIAQATPKWLTDEQWAEMNRKYIERDEKARRFGRKYQVDHIVPLHGDGVCGLHVPWNLRVIPATVNQRKSNKRDDGVETLFSSRPYTPPVGS